MSLAGGQSGRQCRGKLKLAGGQSGRECRGDMRLAGGQSELRRKNAMTAKDSNVWRERKHGREHGWRD